MAGYDEADFPIGDFGRQIAGIQSGGAKRTRELERLDAAAKHRLVPRVASLELTTNGLRDWNTRQDGRITTAQNSANSAQNAASSAQNSANSAQNAASSAQSSANSAQYTANNAYNRTTDLYEQVRLLRLRVEALERK